MAVFSHQPLNALLPDAHTASQQLSVHARAAVRAAAAQVHGSNRCGQLRVTLCPGWSRTLLPGVEAAARHAEDAAHRTNRKGHVPRCDEVELHSLSFAKNVAAAFKMSRSIVSRLLSRRSLASSSRSAVLRVGRTIPRINLRALHPSPQRAFG